MPYRRHWAVSPVEPAPPGAGPLFMKLLLASLTMLFGATVVAYVAIRFGAQAGAPAPRLPPVLWLSTLLLAISGVTIQRAKRAAAGADQRTLVRALGATTVLGLAFLIAQAAGWWALLHAEREVAGQLGRLAAAYVGQFLFMTGLHAAHVVGGLVPLIVVTRRAARGRYTPSSHPGVGYCALYWHFLGAVWLVLLAVLVVTHRG